MPRQTLATASRKAAKQAMVDRAGGLGTSKEDFFSGSQLSPLQTIVGDFIERVKSNLQAEDAVVTGKIEQIEVETTDNGVNILAPVHLIYVDKGVNGTQNKSINDGQGYTDKRPPVQPFIDWIKEKNVQLRDNDKLSKGVDYVPNDGFKELTEDQAIESAAYAMRENRFKYGKPATNVYTSELPQLIDELAEAYADFLVTEMFS